MSLLSIFDISATGMNAQSVRMKTIASNLANATNVTGSRDTVYKARVPVFQAILKNTLNGGQHSVGVRVAEIIESQAPATRIYDPKNPLADKKGFVYRANVNAIEERADMKSASRNFQKNVEVMNTTRQMLLSLLRLGQ